MTKIIKSKPKVSVVIPFFNRMDLTLRAIKSVQKQSYANIELIVVNDGSSESDSEILELMHAIKKSVYIKLKQNVGPSEARNIGIDKSSGEYIAFLDSDDLWQENKLSVQIETMLHNSWGFSHTSYFRYDESKNRNDKVSSGRSHYKFPFIAFSCKIATPTVIVKKSFLGKLRFNRQLKVGEDLLLWIELSKKHVLHGIDVPLAFVYVRPTTTARNRTLKNEALRNVAVLGLLNYRVIYFIHRLHLIIRKILWI